VAVTALSHNNHAHLAGEGGSGGALTRVPQLDRAVIRACKQRITTLKRAPPLANTTRPHL
jgi:hypothetical protein